MRIVNGPIKFGDFDPTPPARPPELGAHTDEVLGELGLSTEEIGRLRESEVIR